MSDKQHILESIAAVAKRLGRTPSLQEFVSRTDLSKSFVLRRCGKWNDAVREAGLAPRRVYKRPLDRELLKNWGEVVRRKGGAPTRSEYRLEGKFYPVTVGRRFGGWGALPRAFRGFAKGKREWADVVAILHDNRRRKVHRAVSRSLFRRIAGRPARNRQLKDRAIYGNPIDFRGLRHEPVNEQGVVLLFGMLARELGYQIEAVQKGFPDCEAKRQIGPERWQRVHIEFEFQSRNFRRHGHPEAGCDVIICWRHNWPDCPANIEVLELSSVIKSLAG